MFVKAAIASKSGQREARDLVISDATEGGGEPCLRINAVQLGGFDQRIGDGGGLGRAF